MHFFQKNIFFVAALFTSFFAMAYEEANFIYKGRVEVTENNKALLISPGSSVTFSFTGTKCNVRLQSGEFYQKHNYVVLELDGKYLGRIKIGADLKSYPVTAAPGKTTHILTIYKATEAVNGDVLFDGTDAKVVKTAIQPKTKIEFIGASVTSGMGADKLSVPCGKGEWFDQHNAYYAYGPVAARALNADFMLSSVSGIGVYRNWNDEHESEPVISNVYENLYLNWDTSKPYDFSFQPDITCIALGNNDLSGGDGKKERLPFDEEKFISAYIRFIKLVYRHSPATRIVLIAGPADKGEKSVKLMRCLKQIQENFIGDVSHEPVEIVEFKDIVPHGCNSHPDINDHKLMAAQLVPVLRKMAPEK